MNTDTFVLSIIAYYAGAEAISNQYSIPIMQIDETYISEHKDLLSINQRQTLIIYMYLYYKLKDDSELLSALNQIRQSFAVSKMLIDNCSTLINNERLTYIKEDYEKKNKKLFSLFYETDDYIADMITKINLMPLYEDKKVLTNLSSFEYEHPEDKSALQNLKGNSVLDKVFKVYSKYSFEKIETTQLIGSSIKVTAENFPNILNMVKEACKILNITEVPDVYIQQGFINAFTTGIDTPVLVLTASSISLLEHDELMFIIGHELGHIKSEHLLYHSIGQYLPLIAEIVGNALLGIGNIVTSLASTSFNYALYNWIRKSELTADRAGLLACQNIDAALSVISKLAGYPTLYYSSIKPEYILKQAKEFKKHHDDTTNKILQTFLGYEKFMDHPWLIMRADELNNWVQNGSYKRVIDRLPFKSSDTLDSNMCPNCKQFITPGANFCKKCGTKLN